MTDPHDVPLPQDPLDIIDFLSLAAGAAYPPLLVVSVAQWWIRRNRSAMGWIARHMHKLRAQLPHRLLATTAHDASPTTHQFPANVESEMAEGDIIPLLGTKTHLLIVGGTGGGKSVLLHNLAAHVAATGNVLVCDIDAMRGHYPGYRVVGAGDDYATIATALTLIRTETEKRRTARAGGTKHFRPLWLFIDEAHDVFAEVAGARDLFIDLVRRGRKLNMHAVIGTQDAQVKTLGIEGQSKTLINLTRVDVACVGADTRTATIEGASYPIPALPMPDDLCRPHRPPDQVSSTLPHVPQTTRDIHRDVILAGLLATSLSQSREHYGTETARPRPQSPDSCQTTMELDQTTINRLIKEKYESGMSKNKIFAWLKDAGVTRSKGDAWKMIDRALA